FEKTIVSNFGNHQTTNPPANLSEKQIMRDCDTRISVAPISINNVGASLEHNTSTEKGNHGDVAALNPDQNSVYPAFPTPDPKINTFPISELTENRNRAPSSFGVKDLVADSTESLQK